MHDWEDEDDLQKPYIATGARPLWSELEGGVYAHFHASGAKLPSGTYRCVTRHDHGICLKLVESRHDDFLALPDPVAEDLIEEAQRFWHAGQRFRELGFLHKRGFLLMGPAGCGKTCIVNKVADHVIRELDGLVLLIIDPEQAETALSNLRQVEPERPVLAIIEDIDSMLSEGCEERLLSLLDGKTQIDHVLFIATTNYPERLGARLQARPSRFDRVEVLHPPSEQVRRAFLEKTVSKLPSAEMDRWVELSEGFSIAHLKELILAVHCFGVNVDDAAARLKGGLKPRHTSDNFIRSRMGFARAGG